MKVLIVDDEPMMLLVMKRMLANVEGVELVGSFQQAEEAFAYLCNHNVDLVFLDIQIGSDDGIDFARKLRLNEFELDIVFTTSHADYAIEAYDVYPLDYMVKPISKKRMAQTIKRAASKRYGSVSVSRSPMVKRLKVKALGCFEVSSTHQGVVKWISKKSEELFAYLLLNRGGNVAKMKVIEHLFPEMPLKNAERYLNTAVYQLRKALNPHGFKEIVISGQEKYRLDLSHVDVDFIQFEQGVELLSKINHDNEAVAIELEKQFVGELLEDEPFLWATTEREGMNILYASYAKELVNWLLACKQYLEALQIVRRVIARDPFDEEANQLLLRILGEMGDKHALHRYYHQYAEMMQQELDLQPSIAMRQIYHNYK